MSRNKITLIVLGVIFAGLLVSELVILGQARGAVRAAREQRDLAGRELSGLYGADPFPSEANAEQTRAEASSLMGIRDSFTNRLAGRNIHELSLSPSRFIQELQAARDSMRESAPIIEGSRAVPPDFNFGFDRYLKAEAPMPRERDVPRLAQQLAMVELLVAEIYAANVSLTVVARDEFDSGGEESAATSARAGGSARAGARAARAPVRASTGAGSRLYKGEYYSSQRFTLEVSGRQAALESLLNKLSAMRMFVVVNDITLRKRDRDLRAPKDESAQAGDGEGLAILGQKEKTENLISALPPNERIVSGTEVDPPVRAVIELEVLNFGGEES